MGNEEDIKRVESKIDMIIETVDRIEGKLDVIASAMGLEDSNAG